MKRINRSLKLIYFLVFFVIAAVLINLLLVSVFHVHIRSNTSLEPYISSTSMVSETIVAKRGNIYDSNGEVVAQDQKTYDIICYLDKDRLGNKNQIAYVDDPLFTSQVLASILDGDQQDIYYYLTYNPDLYQTEIGSIGRNLSQETMEEILNYPGIHGIGFKESYKRVYPKGISYSPYLIGFAQSDDSGKLVGKMGLESYLNEELSGVDGKHVYQRDKNGYILTGMYEEITEEQNGYDVYLTLDSSVQEALQTAFEEVSEQNNASKAWGAVVEIDSGKILAWGQTPSFDPNVLEIDDYNDYGSQLAYEPGSVMKSFIYAAAMDMGTYDSEDYFNSEPFCYYSSNNEPYRTYSSPSFGCINNAANKSWGTISLDYGLIFSSNVATSTLLCDYVGSDAYLDYVKKFGFFSKVDTDGISETTGILNYTYPSEKLALSYGQGSSVTMLQLIQAYTAIFGNGEMLKPYYIDKIVDSDNSTVVYQGEKTVVSNPISKSTAEQLQALLARVVSDPKGTAQYYGVEEVDVMAKTGTSELISNGAYESEDSITSVMLAFPAEDPQYMIYFAYISPYDYYNHTHSTPVKNLIRKVAILTDVGYKPNEAQLSDPIEKSEMPSYLSCQINDAVSSLAAYDVVIIGNGDYVIDQYPKAGEDVYTYQKVFLLTSKEHIELPDFKGWSRKEIIEYWDLSGINIVLNGYGVVKDQVPSSNTVIDESEEVIVYFDSADNDVVVTNEEE